MREITVYDFEKTSNGIQTHLYRLENITGASITLCDMGATIMSLNIPDKNGEMRDVVLGYKHINEYVKESSYFGATIGRCCGRIDAGKFTLNDKDYQLAVNSGGNHLHGGNNCFSRRIWDARYDTESVTFSLNSPDGDENYPGNMDVSVKFTLTDDNELILEYNAVSDADTLCNLTNHTYFNLNGSDSGKLVSENHFLTVHGSSFIELNNMIIPTGNIVPVADTLFDFRSAKLIKEAFDLSNPQIKLVTDGIDHMYVVDRDNDGLVLAGELECPDSGIKMLCYTTQKGLHIYTANTLEVTAEQSKDNIAHGQYGGICFETQGYPDAINHDNFPSVVLKAGEKYHHVTKFCFE